MKKAFLVIAVFVMLLLLAIPAFAAADSSNDSFENATAITVNSSYSGELSSESSKDFYSFTLNESGKVNVGVTTTMGSTYYNIYDSSKVKVWGSSYSNGVNKDVHLTAGTYYFLVDKDDYYGNYQFKLSFESAYESKSESLGNTMNTIESAPTIFLNTEYKGQLASNDEKDYYKFTLTESGKVNVNSITTMGHTYYNIYDSSNVKVWGGSYSNGVDKTVNLLAGTYYFLVDKDDYYGNYQFKLSFESAHETKPESIGNTLNTIESAPSINLNTEYKGQLANNDEKDYYKFTLTESGCLSIKAVTTMGHTYYNIYDSRNTKVWGGSYSNGVDKTVDLLAGTYYFLVDKDDYLGNYSFNLSCAYANESFDESVDKTLNTIESAPSISVGTDYIGQLAQNDTKDYYKFTLTESGRVGVKAVTTMGHTYYNIYNSSNVKVWGGSFSNGVDKTVDLLAGTYYFLVDKDDYHGNYSFNLSFTSANESFGESVGKTLNTLDSAPSISIGQSYSGQLAQNDDKDYYKLLVTSPGKLMINVKTDMGYTYYHIYNASNTKVWGGSFQNGADAVVELQTGTYYFYVGKDDYVGNYSFSISPEHVCSGTWNEISAPTCTESGSKEHICSVCSKTIEIQTVPAIGHICADWRVSKEATCESSGLRHGTCTVCKESVTENLPQLEHNFGEWRVVSGSKLFPPVKSERRCSLCGKPEVAEDWSSVGGLVVFVIIAIVAVFVVVKVIRRRRW